MRRSNLNGGIVLQRHPGRPVAWVALVTLVVLVGAGCSSNIERSLPLSLDVRGPSEEGLTAVGGFLFWADGVDFQPLVAKRVQCVGLGDRIEGRLVTAAPFAGLAVKFVLHAADGRDYSGTAPTQPEDITAADLQRRSLWRATVWQRTTASTTSGSLLSPSADHLRCDAIVSNDTDVPPAQLKPFKDIPLPR